MHDLAAAPEQEVLRHWQGLGYYSRARNMHRTAQQVVAEYGGHFPATYADLLKLRGMGPYTAAAIASFAFDEAVAVLDGNVFRVLARVFGLHSDIAAPARARNFRPWPTSTCRAAAPADFNQAIMEFGAIQCTPAKPDCLFCPLQSQCWAFQHGQVALLPVKSKAKAARTRYFHYFVLRHGEQLYLKERARKRHLAGPVRLCADRNRRGRPARRRTAAPPGGPGRQLDTSQAAEPAPPTATY